MKKQHVDWTKGRDGRSNSSLQFLSLVAEVERLLCGHNLGTPPSSTARLIMAQLAHVHGLRPSAGAVARADEQVTDGLRA